VDVVAYCQNVFLPAMAEIDSNMHSWKNGLEEEFKPWPHDIDDGLRLFQNHIVVWYHNESMFYANDQRNVGWVHKDAKAIPWAKSEGPSLMVADFVSTDYGWLCFPDSSETACVLFKAGALWEGYFINEDILRHARCAINILEKHRPNKSHKLVFDNAPTHLKCADDALSAHHMPKNTPKVGTNWGVQVNDISNDGKPIHGPDGKVLKHTVPMANGYFVDGSTQEFYYPTGCKHEGMFKGMAVILKERGYEGCTGHKGKLTECSQFKCTPGATDCCCCHILFNKPDFVNITSLLEIECSTQGFQVIFLLKFHCELNFIE
jgi:hypothetical protein